MADQVVIPCPKCGKVSQFKAAMSGSGESATNCPNCHKMFMLIIKQGKIVGAK